MESYVDKWGEAVEQPSVACGAYSSTALIESRIRAEYGLISKLSEQELIEMTDIGQKKRDKFGVAPLHVNSYFRQIMRFGIGLEEHWDPSNPISYPRYRIDNYRKLNFEEVISELKSGRPVVGVMRIDLSFWVVVKGDVYAKESEEGETDEKHAVLVVGTEDDENEILVIKNSKGPDWGDSGYYKVTKSTFTSYYTVGNIIKVDDDDRMIELTLLQMEKAKLEGNKLVEARQYEKAIRKYDHALQFALEMPESVEIRSKCHHNRGICFFKLERYEDSLKEFTRALELDPTYIKALHRRVRANEKLKNYDKVVVDMEKICKLDPTNEQAPKTLANL